MLCNSDESAEKESRYVDIAVQGRVAGVILSPSGPASSVAKLAARGTPYVAVDRPLPGHDSDVVLVDTRSAAREATAHLVAQGHERIGCSSSIWVEGRGGPPSLTNSSGRRATPPAGA